MNELEFKVEELTQTGCEIWVCDLMIKVSFDLVNVDTSFDHAFSIEKSSHAKAKNIKVLEVYNEDGETELTEVQLNKFPIMFEYAINSDLEGKSWN